MYTTEMSLLQWLQKAYTPLVPEFSFVSLPPLMIILTSPSSSSSSLKSLSEYVCGMVLSELNINPWCLHDLPKSERAFHCLYLNRGEFYVADYVNFPLNWISANTLDGALDKPISADHSGPIPVIFQITLQICIEIDVPACTKAVSILVSNYYSLKNPRLRVVCASAVIVWNLILFCVWLEQPCNRISCFCLDRSWHLSVLLFDVCSNSRKSSNFPLSCPFSRSDAALLLICSQILELSRLSKQLYRFDFK